MSFRPAGNVFSSHALDNICWRCSSRQMMNIIPKKPTITNISKLPTAARPFSQATSFRNVLRSTPVRLKAGYFVPNETSIRIPTKGSSILSDAIVDGDKILPHRRRQQRRKEATRETTTSAVGTATAEATEATESADDVLPANASSVLADAATKQTSSLRRQISLYLSLSKPRLTVLVVLTAMAPYALYPVPEFIAPSIGLDTPSLSPLTLAFLTTGTALCSASANTLNMLYEPTWDGMMSRTRNRPLVRGLISNRRALVFAVLAAAVGISGLYFGVNPTVAFLGAANIALYAGVYTPLKRVSWLNTWAGAVVGGIPPLMGWAAAAGEYATGDGSFSELLLAPEAVGGWLLAALLFAWQFPHFMALSWTIRDEYKRAGHQMLSWINPARNARVALRYSVVFVPLCVAMCAAGVTEWSYAATSLPVNLWLVREAVRFYRHEGFKGSARGLFWASIWHLPVVMVLALVQKKGIWGRVWRSVVGEPDLDDEDEEDYYDDDEEEHDSASRSLSTGSVSGGVAPVTSG